MTTRNTARRVHHSDTATARHLMELEDALRGGNAYIDTTQGQDGSQQRLDQLETGIAVLRQEFAAALDSLRVEVTAELTHMNSSLGTELSEVKGHLANLVQALTNISATLNQTQSAQQLANEAREQGQLVTTQDQVSDVQQAHDVPMMAMDGTVGNFSSATMTNGLRLRKMDVSPPTFDGLIDGIKLNSFIFQFESYFQQKGYNLTQHDHLLPQELNQCVRKNALYEMVREFREPNFQAKVRSQLLEMKQTGAYHGYVNKFLELQRVVGLDELTSINAFVNRLTTSHMRIAIQRKQLMTLTAAVQEGFLEWELQDKPTPAAKGETHLRSSSNKPSGGYHKCGFRKAVHHSNKSSANTTTAASSQKSPCKHCGRGFHSEDDCWIKHPQKHPPGLQQKQQLHKKNTLC
ncbi:hypothetical protein PHMEG_00012270 [Phytophthora megakarya]|uniref:Retrotransposon gag domain-containing protein n=1 Tax=Phytophthora megakarya TaxID=4795 RepID=A0A225WAW0_9STRA|nr:hypothetical protein PHMEG_00012270 [Phytophthora megakarya]